METRILTPGGLRRLAKVVFHRLLLLSALSVTPLSAAGAANYALEFDGTTNGRVQAATSLFSNVVDSFTVELWVNPTGFRASTAETNAEISDINQRFAVFPDHGDLGYGLNHACAGLSIGTNGVSVFEHAVNYLPSVLVYSNNLSGWTHVALVYVNKQPRIYLNGTLAHAGLTSKKDFIHPSASLGGSIHALGYGPFQGQLDEVRIWNRPLGQAQIRANMNRSLTGTETGLVVYYRCDEGGGTVLANSAPADPENHGTLVSERLWVPSGVNLADTDHDGMPDVWETKYASCCALNPNDASDAASDCNGNGITNLEESKRGLDPCDTTKPVVVSAASTASFDTVLVTFSKELDPATANVAANYTITPTLAVFSVSYLDKVATLTTAAQPTGGTAYTVTVQGVKDFSNWDVPEGSNTAKFFSHIMIRSGVLKFSFWGGIPGTAVQDLTGDPRYPATPDRTGAVFSCNSRDIFPTDIHDNYGATMEGYLTPTESGDYSFFLRSDGASELYISTDATEANLVLRAYELGCCDAFKEPGDEETTLSPLALVAGIKYFIRVIYKEGGGGDFAQVAWRKTTTTTPAASLRPIPGNYLSAAVDLPAPAEGAYVTQSPAPNAADVLPDTAIMIVHRDGKTPWTADNITLQIDGAAVISTFTKEANVATITYQPASFFPSETTHTITIGHPDPAGQPTMTEWSFSVAEYRGPILDKVNGYPAFLMGAARQTDDGGGHSGAAGDLALDTGTGTGVGYVPDASFINPTAADDTNTVAFFQKLRAVRDSSAFWVNSPSSSGTRGIQAHTPWSNNNIYFDTSGCCSVGAQRINSGIDTFPAYSGDSSWWHGWHHFAFVKSGSQKRIYIDGNLFFEGDGGDPLKTDFTTLVMGGGPSITENRMDGFLDDFVVYNRAFNEGEAWDLSRGLPPSAIPGLIAHWDFNTLAGDVTQPGDSIELVNGANDGDADAGPPPAGEGVEHAIDNAGQKYLNFLDQGSGLAVKPRVGLTTVTGLRLYTANDEEARDPASFLLEGSPAGLAGPWTLIAGGLLALPTGRNSGGNTPLGANFQEVHFANAALYAAYRLTFPTLKNAGAAIGMQVGEIELLGTVTPPLRMGLNFGADEYPNMPNAGALAPTTVAGAVPQAHWNNLTGANGHAASLTADDQGSGSPTSVFVTWVSPNTWSSTGRGEENNDFPVGGDRTLMTGHLDTSDQLAAAATVTVGGLGPEFTANGYDVLVYCVGGVAGRGGAYTIGSTTKFGTAPASPNSHVEDPGVDLTDSGTYVRFHGLSGSSFTLMSEASAGPGKNFRAPINGIQIVATPACTAPRILNGPGDVVTWVGSPATFEVSLDGTPPYQFQWERNGLPIPGATARSYTIPSVVEADDGARYSVSITNVCGVANSPEATLHVIRNPRITHCTSRGNCHAVYVTYNKPMLLDGVYTIVCSNTVQGFVTPLVVTGIGYGLSSNEIRVEVTPDLLPDTNVYCMTVLGAHSADGLVIDPNPQIRCFTHGAEFPHGNVMFERYDTVGNGNLTAFLNSSQYVNHQPDAVYSNPTGFFETPSNIREDYGGRIFGTWIAPEDANYFFWMSSDDQGATYISTDGNPARKVPLCSEPAWSGARAWADAGHDNNDNRGSPPVNGSIANYPMGIPLVIGQAVYLEGLFTEGVGSDNYALTVKVNDPTVPTNGFPPISADQFRKLRRSPDGTLFTTLCDVFCNPWPSDQTTVVGQAATFNGSPDGTPPYRFQWMKNGIPIPGANAATYTTPLTVPADDGTVFALRVSNDFSTNSCSAVLHVRPATALSITRLGSRVVLSWPVSALNYRLQRANALPASNTWTPAPGSPILGGGIYRITNSIPGAQEFYRLINP